MATDNNKAKDDAPERIGFRFVKAAGECAPRFDYRTNLVLRELARMANNKDGSCWPRYERLMHYTGFKSKSPISEGLKDLMQRGVLFKARRFGTSNLYHLSLSRMHALRKPYLKADKLELLKGINKYVSDEPAKQLTPDRVLAIDDDEYVWDVLAWYLDLLEHFEDDSATPSLDGRLEDYADTRIGGWEHWRNFAEGFLYDDKWQYDPTSGYREIREQYLAAKGLSDVPPLDWPNREEEKDRERYITKWQGFECGVCAERHLGDCDPVAKKKAEAYEECPKCSYRIRPKSQHVCSKPERPRYRLRSDEPASVEYDEVEVEA